MKCYKKRARPFLLLEILIAFGLVALCIFPLVASQVKILTAEKALQSKLQDQRKANLLFTQLIERMYRQQTGIHEEAIQLGEGFTAHFNIKQQRESEEHSYYVVNIRLEKGGNSFNYFLFCEKEGLI